MEGYVTLTHWSSGDKIHIKQDNILAFRETKKNVLLLMKGSSGMYVSETMEQIAFLLKS